MKFYHVVGYEGLYDDPITVSLYSVGIFATKEAAQKHIDDQKKLVTESWNSSTRYFNAARTFLEHNLPPIYSDKRNELCDAIKSDRSSTDYYLLQYKLYYIMQHLGIYDPPETLNMPTWEIVEFDLDVLGVFAAGLSYPLRGIKSLDKSIDDCINDELNKQRNQQQPPTD
jgi:hypothetical protein